MILYKENPNDFSKKKNKKKTTVRNDKFQKVAEYKINLWKSVAFLYVNNKLSGKEIRKQSHLQWHKNT